MRQTRPGSQYWPHPGASDPCHPVTPRSSTSARPPGCRRGRTSGPRTCQSSQPQCCCRYRAQGLCYHWMYVLEMFLPAQRHFSFGPGHQSTGQQWHSRSGRIRCEDSDCCDRAVVAGRDGSELEDRTTPAGLHVWGCKCRGHDARCDCRHQIEEGEKQDLP